jgi:HEPN domain-containing protein
VRQWFKLALNDLKTAQALEPLGSSYRAGAAFFSQQSVEKAIKGYLAFHGSRFPKTHKIKDLLAIVKDGALTKGKVQTAVKLAQETFNVISEAIEHHRKD